MSCKSIAPGDFVFNYQTERECHHVARSGIVVAVRHPRGGHHMGCEERVHVLWSQSQNFSEMCDCELITLRELS